MHLHRYLQTVIVESLQWTVFAKIHLADAVVDMVDSATPREKGVPKVKYSGTSFQNCSVPTAVVDATNTAMSIDNKAKKLLHVPSKKQYHHYCL